MDSDYKGEEMHPEKQLLETFRTADPSSAENRISYFFHFDQQQRQKTKAANSLCHAKDTYPCQ